MQSSSISATHELQLKVHSYRQYIRFMLKLNKEAYEMTKVSRHNVNSLEYGDTDIHSLWCTIKLCLSGSK